MANGIISIPEHCGMEIFEKGRALIQERHDIVGVERFLKERLNAKFLCYFARSLRRADKRNFASWANRAAVANECGRAQSMHGKIADHCIRRIKRHAMQRNV